MFKTVRFLSDVAEFINTKGKIWNVGSVAMAAQQTDALVLVVLSDYT